jgi:hypothetical protein
MKLRAGATRFRRPGVRRLPGAAVMPAVHAKAHIAVHNEQEMALNQRCQNDRSMTSGLWRDTYGNTFDFYAKYLFILLEENSATLGLSHCSENGK